MIEQMIKNYNIIYLDEIDSTLSASNRRIFLSTTHGGNIYSDEKFQEGDFIMFGKESSGVPDDVHNAHKGIRVPMVQTSTRSLNLSNTVAIIAYEALKQIDFPNMK